MDVDLSAGSGVENNRDQTELSILLEFYHEFEPVLFRHVDIQKDQVRLYLTGIKKVNGEKWIGDRFQTKVRIEFLHQGSQHLKIILIVVDVDDISHGAQNISKWNAKIISR